MYYLLNAIISLKFENWGEIFSAYEFLLMIKRSPQGIIISFFNFFDSRGLLQDIFGYIYEKYFIIYFILNDTRFDDEKYIIWFFKLIACKKNPVNQKTKWVMGAMKWGWIQFLRLDNNVSLHEIVNSCKVEPSASITWTVKV